MSKPEEDFFEMANLFPADTGLPMVVWVSERGDARHDLRVKVNQSHETRMLPGKPRGGRRASSATTGRRQPVARRSQRRQRVDSAERGGAGRLLGISDQHRAVDPAVAPVADKRSKSIAPGPTARRHGTRGGAGANIFDLTADTLRAQRSNRGGSRTRNEVSGAYD